MDTQVHKNVCMCSVTQSCLTLCHLRDCSSLGSSIHWDFSGKNIGMSCHFPLQGIFSTQGSNSCLLRLLHWQAENKNFEPYNSHRCGSSLQTKHESKCFLFIIHGTVFDHNLLSLFNFLIVALFLEWLYLGSLCEEGRKKMI